MGLGGHRTKPPRNRFEQSVWRVVDVHLIPILRGKRCESNDKDVQLRSSFRVNPFSMEFSSSASDKFAVVLEAKTKRIAAYKIVLVFGAVGCDDRKSLLQILSDSTH